jgi:glycosyltransferase involved in cell wall biosynthesis
MLHPPALEQKWFKKKIYLAVLKPILKWRRVAFHATDAAEAEYIRSYAGVKSKVFVVPNFPGMLELMPAHKESGKLKLITVALIGPMKNHHLVLKALRQCKEEIEYIICGPVYVREYWQNCEELISQLPPNIKVNYVGSVPNEQVRYLLRDAHVFICPSKSENYGHAIVEALSAGKPVIISHNTPWHLLKEQRSGLNSDLNEASLANAISFFAAMDNTVYSDWVNGAGDYVKRHVNMDSIRKGYNNMFSSDI